MAKEQEIVDYVTNLGYQPSEGMAIIVTYKSKDLSEAVSKFFNNNFYVLQICTSEIVLLPFDINVFGIIKLEEQIELAIPFETIKTVEVAESALNYDITISTDDDKINLSTQQAGLSAFRLSGALSNTDFFAGKNWHSENLDKTLAVLRDLKKV